MPTHPSLRELLAAQRQEASKWHHRRGEFAAQQAEIEEALRDHWSLKEIWSALKKAGRIGMTYSTFHRHARKLLTPKAEAEAADRSSSRPAPAKPAGFVHNPSPNPKDLF